MLYLGSAFVERHKRRCGEIHTDTEETAPAVTITLSMAVHPTETIVLPGNIVGWFEAPIYAQVTGYVNMWHKD